MSDQEAARRKRREAYARNRDRRLAAEARGERYVAEGITHGTLSGYGKHHCRCQDCVDAQRRKYDPARRAARYSVHWRQEMDQRNESRRKHAQRKRDAEARGETYVAEGIEHGTFGALNAKCQCDACRQALREYMAGLRARRRALRLAAEARGEIYVAAGIKHGLNGWVNWKCQCKVCVDAHLAYEKKRKARRRGDRGGVGS